MFFKNDCLLEFNAKENILCDKVIRLWDDMSK